MNDLFRPVDTLETEGDFREDYAVWMADMEGVEIVASGSVEIKYLETEDLPF
mgnify:FL=1|jgi:hypothetical protein